MVSVVLAAIKLLKTCPNHLAMQKQTPKKNGRCEPAHLVVKVGL
jgi:hypothetical protein